MDEPMRKLMIRWKKPRKVEFDVNWAGRNAGAAIALIVLAIVFLAWEYLP